MKTSRKHIRWRNWDYHSPGAYFITICTHKMEHSLGEVKKEIGFQFLDLLEPNGLTYPNLNSYLQPTLIGEIAYNFWEEIPHHYPQVLIEAFVVMPNHIHGILILDKKEPTNWKPNRFGPHKGNLSNIIGSYKAAVKRKANLLGISFKWQYRYHDRVIRNAEEFSSIQKYIWNNPSRWNGTKIKK